MTRDQWAVTVALLSLATWAGFMVWMFITMIHQYGWLTTMIIPVGSTLACVGFAWALDATMDGDE